MNDPCENTECLKHSERYLGRCMIKTVRKLNDCPSYFTSPQARSEAGSAELALLCCLTKELEWQENQAAKDKDDDAARWEMSDEWFDRYKPERGGYLVLYKGGYLSFSPAEAFEDGNTRITMNIQEIAASLAVRRLLDGLTMFETENVLNHVMQMVQEMKQRSSEQLPVLFDLPPIAPLAEVGKDDG